MNSPLTIAIDPSRFPGRVRASVLASLRAGRLPASFLYESPGQAECWLAYHRAWSPSRRDAAVRALYGDAFARAAALLPAGPARLIGLGCGGGQKDAEAAAALLAVEAGEEPARGSAGIDYVPVDASVPLVSVAALRVREAFPGVALHPFSADLQAATHLREWADAACARSSPTLFTCFGMLPNQDAERFSRFAASLLAPGDLLLISANLSPRGFASDRERILAQYENAEARAWYAGALAELGLDSRDAKWEIGAQSQAEDGSAWRIVVDAIVRPGLTLHLFGEKAALPADGRLRVFFSNRFTLEAARRLLERAGLAIRSSWIDQSGEEGIFLCARTP